MSAKVEIGVKSQQEWDEKWPGIFDHYQYDIRNAHYINAILNPNEKKLLEIAAGSFRDAGALNKWGLECYGADFSTKSVELAKKQFPDWAEKISQQNAFEFSFEDKAFDLSYSNGFWGYFYDDDILKLVKEQARITRYRIIATVHNAHNKQFVDYFDRLKQNDPLYKLRFFEMAEITELMKSVAKNVKIIPVGKGKKYYEDDLINIGLGEAEYIRKSFDYHKLNLLETSERLMCIGEL